MKDTAGRRYKFLEGASGRQRTSLIGTRPVPLPSPGSVTRAIYPFCSKSNLNSGGNHDGPQTTPPGGAAWWGVAGRGVAQSEWVIEDVP